MRQHQRKVLVFVAAVVLGFWTLAGEPPGTPDIDAGASSPASGEGPSSPPTEDVDLDPLAGLEFQKVSVPGPVGDDVLRRDIRSLVHASHAERRHGCEDVRVAYVEVTHVAKRDPSVNQGDVRTIIEEWFVDNCGRLAAYEVVLSPTPSIGGVQIQVQYDASPDTSFRGWLHGGSVAHGVLEAGGHHAYVLAVPDQAQVEQFVG